MTNASSHDASAAAPALTQPVSTWQSVVDVVKGKLNTHSFETWFLPTKQSGSANGTVTVEVPSALFQKRLTVEYAELLQEALVEIAKPELHLEFIAVDRSKTDAAKPPKKAPEPEIAAPIPEGAWYGLSAEYRALCAPRTEASPNYHLAGFLGAIGACLGRRVFMDMGGRIHPNLFLVTIGRSAFGRKSTSVNFGVDLVRAVDPGIGLIDSLDSREGFLEHLAEFTKKQKSFEVSALVHLGELRSLIEKTRIEGLGGIVPMLCNAYDAPGELAVHTRKNPIQVDKPVVSLLAATTTRWMEGLQDKDLEGGLGNRICWVPGEPGEPIPHPVARDEQRWRRMIAKLRRAIKAWHPDKPTRFLFSLHAAKRWEEIYRRFYKRAVSDDPLIAILSGRMQNHCLKTAMIWAALDGTNVIDVPQLEAALVFTEYLYDSLWGLFRGFGASPMAKLDQQIIEKVRECGPQGIRQRQLKKLFWRTDAEIFNKRLYYLSMNDGPLSQVKDGQKVWVTCNGDGDEHDVN
jgi:hypothetical protein